MYCKDPCDAVAPGKLRVRCAQCKDTSFLLSKVLHNYAIVEVPLDVCVESIVCEGVSQGKCNMRQSCIRLSVFHAHKYRHADYVDCIP